MLNEQAKYDQSVTEEEPTLDKVFDDTLDGSTEVNSN